MIYVLFTLVTRMYKLGLNEYYTKRRLRYMKL